MFVLNMLVQTVQTDKWKMFLRRMNTAEWPSVQLPKELSKMKKSAGKERCQGFSFEEVLTHFAVALAAVARSKKRCCSKPWRHGRRSPWERSWLCPTNFPRWDCGCFPALRTHTAVGTLKAQNTNKVARGEIPLAGNTFFSITIFLLWVVES